MYQVLYRKWRPKTFSDVAGQPQVTETLKQEVQSGRLNHAYLFTGSRGTGKTSCAKILAKAVNCLSPVDGDPCGECEICRGIDSGSVMDVTEIDAASNNGVDNIRDLREEASYTPAAAKYRVFIIDEVHMLSTGAFNALLKTLEEPPAHVLFILATTEVHKLPATILSRCQRFDFRRIPPEDMSARLHYVAGEEGLTLSDAAALLIARLADGALRDALSLLDQCAARSKEIDETLVGDVAGLAGRDYLFDITDAVIANDSAAVLDHLNTLHSASRDMTRLCEELVGHFRNLMLIKTLHDPRGLILCQESEYIRFQQQAQKISSSAVLFALSALEEALERMGLAVNRRILLETTLLRLCDPRLSTSPEALVRRIEQLEDALKSGGGIPTAAGVPVASAERPAQTRQEQAEPETPKSAPAGAMDPPVQQPITEAPVLLSGWPEILEKLATLCPPLHGVLDDSTAYLSGNRVLVDAPNAMFPMLIKQDGNKEILRQAIQQQTGKRYNLGPYTRRESDRTASDSDPMQELAARMQKADIPIHKK
ncbi:MAG: DNA polymerase III subunit gamma/tau [Clostridiales bacterium]|nr:DNA polymerase III subunit gamma/tau [Clostridiales bacterium]